MNDIYWSGIVNRISPEAPVPLITVKDVETRQGAAANVANNVEAMGIPCERFFGSGRRIEKIRIFSTQPIVRVDFDYPQEPIEPDATFEDALRRCDIVILVDYAHGALEKVAALIQLARTYSRTILVDPKGVDYNRYRGATLIKPNKYEFKELVGGWRNQDELDFKARQFLLSSDIESILLTQSEQRSPRGVR